VKNLSDVKCGMTDDYADRNFSKKPFLIKIQKISLTSLFLSEDSPSEILFPQTITIKKITEIIWKQNTGKLKKIRIHF
jgi:hypothetical protein